MTLIETIENKYGTNKPFFIEDLVTESLNYETVKSMLSSFVKQKIINRYSQGIYYIPKNTIVGKSIPNVEEIIEKKYLKDNKQIIGYVSGLALLNRVGLTNEVSNVIEITTNKETNFKRIVTLNKTKLILRKPKIKITNDNYKYLMFLDIIRYSNQYQLSNNINIIKDIFYEFELKKDKLFNISLKDSRNIRKKMILLNLYDELA